MQNAAMTALGKLVIEVTVCSAHLKVNVIVYAALYLPHVYSHRWITFVEESLVRLLDSIDAVVFGKFNSQKDSRNISFIALMKKLTAGMDADCEHVTPPALDIVLKP